MNDYAQPAREFDLPGETVERHLRLLAAAASTRGGRRDRPGLRILLAAVIVLLAGAPAAVAFGNDILGFFRGKPATPAVQQNFAWRSELARRNRVEAASGALEVLFPVIDASQAKGVLAVETTEGPLYLWAAPRADGRGDCWLIQFGDEQTETGMARGIGGCDRPDLPQSIAYGRVPSPEHPSLSVVVGRAFGDAASVDVRLATGSPVRLPVVDHYFLAAFDPDAIVAEVTSYDGQGNAIARKRGPALLATIVVLQLDGSVVTVFDYSPAGAGASR